MPKFIETEITNKEKNERYYDFIFEINNIKHMNNMVPVRLTFSFSKNKIYHNYKLEMALRQRFLSFWFSDCKFSCLESSESSENEVSPTETERFTDIIDNCSVDSERYKAPYILTDDQIKDIASGKKQSRMLCDMIAVSLSPVVNRRGYEFNPETWNHRKGDAFNMTAESAFDNPPSVFPNGEVFDYSGLYGKRSIGFKLEKGKEFYRFRKKKESVDYYHNMEVLLFPEFLRFFAKVFDFCKFDVDKDGNPIVKESNCGAGCNVGYKLGLFGADSKDNNRGYVAIEAFDPELALAEKEAKDEFRKKRVNEVKDSDKDVKKSDDDYKTDSAYAAEFCKNNPEFANYRFRISNYIRQKVYIKLSGDAVQVLRERGLLFRFLVTLYQYFRDPQFTMLDMTVDLFNYGYRPIDYVNLYKKDQIITRSSIQVIGDPKNPTLYVGKYKTGESTIIMYDKKLETSAKASATKEKADEPELADAVEYNESNTHLRVELHLSRKYARATNTMNYIMGLLWTQINYEKPDGLFDDTFFFDGLKAKEFELSKIFWSRFSAVMLSTVEKKVRFLEKPRKKRNNVRIKTHKIWQDVLDAIGSVPADFMNKRPEVTLDARIDHYIETGIGGKKLFYDIIANYGVDKFHDVNDLRMEKIKKDFKRDMGIDPAMITPADKEIDTDEYTIQELRAKNEKDDDEAYVLDSDAEVFGYKSKLISDVEKYFLDMVNDARAHEKISIDYALKLKRVFYEEKYQGIVSTIANTSYPELQALEFNDVLQLCDISTPEKRINERVANRVKKTKEKADELRVKYEQDEQKLNYELGNLRDEFYADLELDDDDRYLFDDGI